MNTQFLADTCKGYIDSMQHRDKRAVLKLINRFEGYGWHAGIFAQAIADTETADTITLTADNIEFSGHSSDVLSAIHAVLSRYIEIYDAQ